MTIFIAYDEADNLLGRYFETCKNNLLAILEDLKTQQEITFEIILMPSHLCNSAFIEQRLSQNPNQKFVFVAYSHGHEKGNGLLVDGQYYVKASENSHYFHSSLFYSNACSIGKILGQEFENKEGIFVGFNDVVETLVADYQNISMNCDNYALFLFLTKDINMVETLEHTEKYYEEQINKIRKNWRGAVFAAELEKAKDSLVLYGNKNLTRNDFITIV